MWDEGTAESPNVGGDAGHSLGQSEREAEGQYQKPCAGSLTPAVRDTVVAGSVGLCAESVWEGKIGSYLAYNTPN